MPLVDEMEFGVGARPADGAGIEDLVARLEEASPRGRSRRPAGGVPAEHLPLAGSGAALRRTLVSTGLTETALTSTSRSRPLGSGFGSVDVD